MPSSGDQRQLILVDGPSGAGKTQWAGSLQERLGCDLVSLDDIYPGWDGLDAGSHHVFRCGILPWSRGVRGVVQRWDWDSSSPGGSIELDPQRSLIIEGCGAISRLSAPLATESYWLDADGDVRRARALARDGDMFAPHWERWALQEQRFFTLHASRDLAHEVIWT